MGQDSKKKIHARKVACFKATGCGTIQKTRLGAMDDAGLAAPRMASKRKHKRACIAKLYECKSVNRQEFQRLSGLTQPTIREYIKRGLIKTEITGRGSRIPWSEVVRLELV